MTDPDEVKLLPCPFCGGEAIDFQSQHDGLWVVCCDGCSARTGPQLINDLAAQRKAVIATWNTRPPVVTDEVVERDETGWLIEEDAGGVIHWIALVENIWKYGWYVSDRDQPSPVRRVKDSNEALRFARKQDAEAFIKLFDRFLLCATATEHEWPLAAMPAVVSGGQGT